MTAPDPPPTAETPQPDPQPLPTPASPEAQAEGPDEPMVELGAGFDFTDPNSPLAPYYLGASHLVTNALFALFCFYFTNVAPLGYTDVWGHLKFGQWILESGRLPDKEPFSPFSDRNSDYVHFQWLAQAGGYLVFQAGEWLAGGDPWRQLEGGVHLLRTVGGLIVLLRYLTLLAVFRRLTGSLPLACAGIVLVFAVDFAPAAIQRPQMLGTLFFALVLLALSPSPRVATLGLSTRALVLVPLIFLLWANCHGSFLVGLLLLGVFVAGRALEVGREAGTWNPLVVSRDASVRRLVLVLALTSAAVALNPHGPALYLHVLQQARHPNVATMEEWQPLPFLLGPGGHWIYWGLMALLLVSWAVSPRRLTPTQVLLLMTFGVLPLLQQRMMTWWVMLAPTLLLPLWAATGERLALPWPWLHYKSVLSLRKTLLAGMLVVLGLMYSGPGSWVLAGRPRALGKAVEPETPWRLAAVLVSQDQGRQPARLSEPLWPELTKALNAHYPGGRYRGCIYASETVADYLLWSLSPETPVLVYSHVHVFPPSLWEDHQRVLFGRPGWREALDRYGVNLVAVEAALRRELTQQLGNDPEWLVIPEASRGGEPRLLVALRARPLK